MFHLDHIAAWTPERDAALGALSQAVGLPIVEGYAPQGRRVARGLRFSNGPFLEVHQSEAPGPVLIGLAGELRAAEAVAGEQDWRFRLRRGGGPDPEPWSILAFGRGQGLLSSLFVIEYAEDEAAWRSPVFNGGLYHLPPVGGPPLSRVWVTAADVGQAREVLQALNFWAAAEVESPVWPHQGQVFQGRHADIVLAEGDDGVQRIDIATDGPAQVIPLGERLRALVGRAWGEFEAAGAPPVSASSPGSSGRPIGLGAVAMERSGDAAHNLVLTRSIGGPDKPGHDGSR